MCCRRCARRRSSSENRRGSGRRNDDGGRRSWLSRALCNETLVTALSCCCSKHTVLGGQHRAVLGWMHATSGILSHVLVLYRSLKRTPPSGKHVSAAADRSV